MRCATTSRTPHPHRARHLALVSGFALLLSLAVPGMPALADHGEGRGTEAVCPPPEWHETAEVAFTDVGGTTHEDPIVCAARYRVAAGYPDDTYRPDQSVTREQMATFVRNLVETALMQTLPEPDTSPFSDTADSAHASNIDAVARAKIVTGYPDGTYRPKQIVLRGQMATFIANAIDYADDLEINTSAPPPPPEEEQPEEEQPEEGQEEQQQSGSFDDTEGHTHEDSIERLAEQHIVAGDGQGSFHPDRPVTRAAMATFLMQGADYLAELGRWFVGAGGVAGTPEQGERAENLNHRVTGAAIGELEEPVEGTRIRFEAYREGPGAGPGSLSYELVADGTVLTDADGLALFSYNGGAAEGDEDRVIICELDFADEVADGDQFCASQTFGENNVLVSVTPREDRPSTEVSVTWTAAAQPEPALTGTYSGEVIAIDVENTDLDVQTWQDRFRRFDYGRGGTFNVNDSQDVALSVFECAVQATIDQSADNDIDIVYGTQDEDRYTLTTEADLTECGGGSQDSTEGGLIGIII